MPSIYVSYSRSDAPSAVWRVVEQLVAYYGDRAVQGSPPSGSDIEDNVAQSTLVVAVVGPRWSALSGDDLVLISRELEAAFEKRIPIVPVIVEGAAWPPRGDLPGVLKKIAAISAPKVGDETFDSDMGRLTALLDLLLQTSAMAPPESEQFSEAMAGKVAAPEAAPPLRLASLFKLAPWRLWRSRRRNVASLPPIPSRPDIDADHDSKRARDQANTEELTTNGQITPERSAPDPLVTPPPGRDEAEPRGKMDTVEFAAGYPQGVQIGVPFTVAAWVFPQELRETALRRAVEPGTAVRKAVGRGSWLTVRLDLATWEVEPRAQTIFWDGAIANVSFSVSPTGDASAGRAAGICTFFVRGLRIGRVTFEVALTAAKQDERLVAQGARVRNAFASYARKDRRRVLERVRGMKKLGANVFVEGRNHKPDDPYPLSLLKHIDDSDVLYLFWSREAESSEWVEREWRYGKARKGIGFIDPAPLIDPRLVPPPDELAKGDHFNDWVIAYLEAKKSANAWRRFVAWAAGDN
jgi:hypothetical protein